MKILDSLDADLERGLGLAKDRDGKRALSSSPPPIGRVDAAAEDVGGAAAGDILDGGGSSSNNSLARVFYDRGRLPRELARSPVQQAKGSNASRGPSLPI